MKKFLSMVMAAAMVVSLVPATAFAASDDVKATAKVVDAENYADGKLTSGSKDIGNKAELQLTVTTADYSRQNAEAVLTLTLDNAESNLTDGKGIVEGIEYGDLATGIVTITADGVTYSNDTNGYFQSKESGDNFLYDADVAKVKLDKVDVNDDKDEVEYTLQGKLQRGWVINFDLDSEMDKISKGKTATVSVDSDDITISNGDDLTYAAVEAEGIKASVKKTVDIATEEIATLKDVKIETTVGDFNDFITDGDEELKLKLNSGFEFAKTSTTVVKLNDDDITSAINFDEDEIVIPYGSLDLDANVDTWTIEGLDVEATSAKEGTTATIRVYLDGCDTVSVEVAKVVDYAVSMTVDEDEDVPVIYSGVDLDNTGITDDSDHESLEVTVEETFAGAFDEKKDLTFKLPEGVYVAGDDGISTDGTSFLTLQQFKDAYQKDEYESFTVKRRTIESSEGGDKYETTFTMKLVADPNFEGDVVLTMEGDGVEKQEVTIAKFVKPFTVEAQQNDMQIDYRNTEIPTSVVIKEAEAGLWKENTKFTLSLDKILFDDEGTVTVDEKSGLELKDNKVRVDSDDNIYFTVESESDDEPAVVTLSGMQLYMNRSLPAGAYDLEVISDTMYEAYEGETIFAKETTGTDPINTIAEVNEDFVSHTAKAGFVNIVTAGREDTESFTTKVVVPVGESYLISGENKVEIPVPAYINANGYTMLPLRAVAVALGINNDNVLWDQATRTATVMYGSKIINMTYGQKVVYVNGAMIPATAAVEITNDRMFLGLRDLGNALGVTDITWDGATRTATLNGNK